MSSTPSTSQSQSQETQTQPRRRMVLRPRRLRSGDLRISDSSEDEAEVDEDEDEEVDVGDDEAVVDFAVVDEDEDESEVDEDEAEIDVGDDEVVVDFDETVVDEDEDEAEVDEDLSFRDIGVSNSDEDDGGDDMLFLDLDELSFESFDPSPPMDTQQSDDDDVQIIDPPNEEDSQSESDDPSSPPRKQAKIAEEHTAAGAAGPKVPEDKESDGQTCTICYDIFTTSGEHRMSCLRCGHIFGKDCIERWLRLHGRCPQCNCKATRKDVRVLYAKSLQAVDNTELVQTKRDLENSNINLSKQNLENAKLRIQVDSLKQQIKRLEDTQRNFTITRVPSSSNCAADAGPSKSTAATPLAVPAASPRKREDHGRKELKFTFLKHFEIKEGPCRVGAYNEWHNMLVVTHDMKNSLYPNGCGGIKEINMLEMRPLISLAIHQKQIRDVQFSLCQNDVLLSVGMDKKAVLFNVTGNVGVQSFMTEYPLWSCCWDEVHQHLFYVGTSNGRIITYDIRSPQDPISIHAVEGVDHSPINRMRFIRPSYQSTSFNLSGLLIQQLNSVSFCEIRGGNGTELRSHPLPVEGPFTSVDFEPVSRHMLVSTRPSSRALTNATEFQGCIHHLCDLNQFYSEPLERNVVASQTIKTYQGSTREVQRLCRSTIFSPEPNYAFVGANSTAQAVKYWDISLNESQYKTISPSPEFVLDFVHGKLNGNEFLTLVNEKGVRIFKQTLS